MKTIVTIAGRDVIQLDDNSLTYLGPLRIDCDGSDNRHHDPCWQPETSLRLHGRSIDAESVPYGVVPPAIVHGVPGIVMGCQGQATNLTTGQTSFFVVADSGPRNGLGEGSCELARRLGLDGNPNHGGTGENIIRWQIWPGRRAVVDGITYELQPA